MNFGCSHHPGIKLCEIKTDNNKKKLTNLQSYWEILKHLCEKVIDEADKKKLARL